MKYFYLLSLTLFTASGVLGQTPGKINYQAVAREVSTGVPLSDQNVYIVTSIHRGQPDGTIVYQESHDTQTNAFGLFTVFIGGGDVVTGNFSSIDWGADAHWLHVQLDAGDGLQDLGSMQFVSVPYALHAKSAEEVDDADPDPSNELINTAVYNPQLQQIAIHEGVDNEVTIDLSELPVDDADADPTNELITDAFYDDTSGAIVINEGVDNQVSIDMSDFSVDDADNDPTNEMITEFSLTGTNLFIQEVNPHTVSLARFRIDSLRLVDGQVLEVFEGGASTSVDLSVFTDEEHWFRSPEEPVVYNENDRIGVGTSTPEAKMDIHNDVPGTPDFKITSSTGVPLVHIESNRVGFGTDDPTSSVELRGSLAVGVTVIEASDSPYQVSPLDHIVVCRLTSTTPQDLIVALPDPETCPGRLITIRKTGPNPGATSVHINFGGAQLDYANAVLILSGSQPKTVTLLSLGEDGWTELISP